MVQSAITNGHPFTKWKKDLVIAWLEVWVCVPQWYVTALKQSVDSGSLMEVRNSSIIHDIVIHIIVTN
jgi:hypothetical protein